jgi:hypothetical protein
MNDDVVVRTVSKGAAAATKAAGKPKPANRAKDADAKVKTKVPAAVTKNTAKYGVPKPAGAETKKGSKYDLKIVTKPATKSVPVRKGGGSRSRVK